MKRESQRTLFSLSSQYQRQVDALDYEVIAIDNGSAAPLDPNTVKSFGPNFRYHYFETASASPAEAVNYGAEMSRGRFFACIVDGARMASPGLLKHSFAALHGYPRPLVGALSWHLGPKIQNESMLDGYDQKKEDALLESINWKNNGYKLFDIATIAPSSDCGFLGGLPSEYSYFAMPMSEFLTLGGFEPRFQSPGGGLVNHDFLQRAVSSEKAFDLVMLLGEGVFHQFHGGVATNCKLSEHPQDEFENEYESIRLSKFSNLPHRNEIKVTYVGER